MAQFTDKVVVVTGAGRGIGLAMAKAFAGEGAKVAVLSRNPNSCQKGANTINEEFEGSAKAFPVDVADHENVNAVCKEVIEEYGKVNVLINNAGVTRDGLLMRMKPEDWDAVLDTNLKGAFNMVKGLQRNMMKAEDPRIINVASVIGLIGNAGQANYAASKAGLIGFTKSLAAGVGRAEGDGECDCAWIHSDGHDRCAVGGDSGGDSEEDSFGGFWNSGGCGESGVVSCESCGALHYWPGHGGGWWDDDVGGRGR